MNWLILFDLVTHKDHLDFIVCLLQHPMMLYPSFAAFFLEIRRISKYHKL